MISIDPYWHEGLEKRKIWLNYRPNLEKGSEFYKIGKDLSVEADDGAIKAGVSIEKLDDTVLKVTMN